MRASKKIGSSWDFVQTKGGAWPNPNFLNTDQNGGKFVNIRGDNPIPTINIPKNCRGKKSGVFNFKKKLNVLHIMELLWSNVGHPSPGFHTLPRLYCQHIVRLKLF